VVGVSRGGLVAKIATKRVKSTNKFGIAILQWNYPFHTKMEEEEGDNRDDGTKRRVKRPCDRIARLSFGL